MNPNRLLVTDDEEDIREFICAVAEESGFDVAAAEDFERFQSIHGSFNPSLIVLDLQIPGVDGIELLRFLASERSRAHILLVSGMDSRIIHTAKPPCSSERCSTTPCTNSLIRCSSTCRRGRSSRTGWP